MKMNMPPIEQIGGIFSFPDCGCFKCTYSLFISSIKFIGSFDYQTNHITFRNYPAETR